jgi:hypothetical protein
VILGSQYSKGLLWQGNELGEKRPRGCRIEAVSDVGGAADRIAGNGGRRDDIGRPKEVRAAGVAVTGAAISGGWVHGDAQPGGVN